MPSGWTGRSSCWYDTKHQGLLAEDFKHEFVHLNEWQENSLVKAPKSPTSVLSRPDTGYSEGGRRPGTSDSRPRTSASRPGTSASQPGSSSLRPRSHAGRPATSVGGTQPTVKTIPEDVLNEQDNEKVKAWTSYRGHYVDPTGHNPFGPYGDLTTQKTFFKPRTDRGTYQERCIKSNINPSKPRG